MLQHVDGQQFVIQHAKGRTGRDPDQQQSCQEAGGAPPAKRKVSSPPKPKPTAQVERTQKDQNQCEDPADSGVMVVWHNSNLYGFEATGFCSASDRAKSREAS